MKTFCTEVSGEPIPWINYPMLHFLTPRLPEHISLLEYGSGNSTLYWAAKVKQVTAVEHDTLWIDYIRKRFSGISNIQLLTAGNDEGYETAPKSLDRKFQLIIIDGIRRIECVRRALELLSEDGCILVDDTQFPEFKELRISGAKPIQNDRSEATVFYRPNNILDI